MDILVPTLFNPLLFNLFSCKINPLVITCLFYIFNPIYNYLELIDSK